MSEAARRYLVAYDIADDRRRDRVAKCLETYGDRVQYSVFIVDGRPAKLVRLRAELEQRITPAEDSVLFADMGPVSGLEPRRFNYLGRAAPLTPHGPLVL